MTAPKSIADLARRWEKLANSKRQSDRDRARFVATESGAEFARAYLSALAVVEAARDAHNALSALIDQSEGVAGLHLNGDVAEWPEIIAGGRYEEWLLPFDKLHKELSAHDAHALGREAQAGRGVMTEPLDNPALDRTSRLIITLQSRLAAAEQNAEDRRERIDHYVVRLTAAEAERDKAREQEIAERSLRLMAEHAHRVARTRAEAAEAQLATMRAILAEDAGAFDVIAKTIKDSHPNLAAVCTRFGIETRAALKSAGDAGKETKHG